MGKNTKYYEVDQLNLNATNHRRPDYGSNFTPKLSCMSKEDRRKEIWGAIFGFTVVFGPFIYYLIF